MKYIANPVEVDAFVIRTTQRHLEMEGIICVLDDGRSMTASPAMIARMEPKPGDYWVVQSDGYEYLNPKAVFERKYSPKPIPQIEIMEPPNLEK